MYIYIKRERERTREIYSLTFPPFLYSGAVVLQSKARQKAAGRRVALALEKEKLKRSYEVYI